jgi:hypothetical protein
MESYARDRRGDEGEWDRWGSRLLDAIVVRPYLRQVNERGGAPVMFLTMWPALLDAAL